MPTPETPQVLYVVLDLAPGFAREDAAAPRVVAALHDEKLARRVQLLTGGSSIVQEVTVGEVPKGLYIRSREILGVELTDFGG